MRTLINIGGAEMKYQRNIYVLLIIVLLYLVLVFSSAEAKVTGPCVNCHTMHNSQNGTAMATDRGSYGTPRHI